MSRRADLSALVAGRLSSLARMSYAELESLPPYSESENDSDEASVVVATWRDSVGAEGIQVVVQARRTLRLGAGVVSADGFRIERSGRRIRLTGVELSAFL